MPDLKKLLTLEALSAALPSWLKRSTKPEYNADEIDSANTTNQFVSASDKDNWNAKGTYSKPSDGIPKSDLSSLVQASLEKAESALQSETDPTVPSWAKQTNKPSYTQDEVADGSTYKRVTQTEKDTWSRKQNALTTTQMQAINSGITSANLAQIIRNGAKNQLKLTGDVINPNMLRVYWDYENGTVRVTGSIATNSTVFINLGSWTAPEDGVYRLYANAEACTANIRVYDDALWNTFEGAGGGASDEATWTKGTTRTLYLRIASNVVVGDITVTPMICPKSIFDADPTFAPHAFSNSDLTRLESEDRAELVELVDSGAKNKLKISGASATVGEAVFTVSSDGTISIYTTATTTTQRSLIITASTDGVTLNANDIVSGVPSSDNKVSIEWGMGASGNTKSLWGNSTDGYTTVGYTGSVRYFAVVISSGKSISSSSPLVFKPMVCTLADWKVSPKFVPYRLPYQTLGNLRWKTYEVSLASVSFIKSGGGLYYYYFSVTNDFSEVLSVTIAGFSAVVNKGFSAYTEAGKIGLLVYDATDPQSLAFTSGQIWLRVVGFK